MKKILTLLLSLALLLAFAACEWEPVEEPEPEAELVEEEPEESEETVETVETSWLTFDSYEELYAAVAEVAKESSDNNTAVRTDEVMESEGAAEEPAMSDSAAAAAEDTGLGGDNDYSTTNLQVEGVDEADIVKTDGEYIYILREGMVTVVRAAGPDSEEVNSFAVCDADRENTYEYPLEMYLDGDALRVVTQFRSWQEDESVEKTVLRSFDVADPESGGELLYQAAQDGCYLDSRLLDGVVYLISSHYIYTEPEEDELRTFVPQFYDSDDKPVSAPIDDIVGCPGFSSVSYAIVSAVDAESGERLSQETVLGAGDTVYMSADNLYLAHSRYEEEESEPYTESVYQVVERTSRNYTDIVRFSIADGQVEMKAFTELEGVLSDQFALDEYEGDLRVALTASTSKYKIYTDEERGFVNYLWEDDSDATENVLYVLDADLRPVGQLDGLAENEWIRSVRFSGPIGYICTFDTIDPLFAVDLSDPASPQVLSALKIPGFSEYLHPWGEDRLLGLGYATSEDGGALDCVKLSMFDCSDLTDVQETDVYPLNDLWYSEALYNHKAVTASPEKNLICFPGEGSYLLFAYDEGQGFRQLAEVSLDENYWYDWNSRGLWSGDYFYVASPCGVAVLDMADYSVVKELYFDDGTTPDHWLYSY